MVEKLLGASGRLLGRRLEQGTHLLRIGRDRPARLGDDDLERDGARFLGDRSHLCRGADDGVAARGLRVCGCDERRERGESDPEPSGFHGCSPHEVALG